MKKKFWIPFVVNYALIHTAFSFFQYDAEIAFTLLIKTLIVSLTTIGLPLLAEKIKKKKDR